MVPCSVVLAEVDLVVIGVDVIVLSILANVDNEIFVAAISSSKILRSIMRFEIAK